MVAKWSIPLILLVLASCQREQWDDCVTSAGPERTEERTVGAFHTIDLNDRVDLLLEDRPEGTLIVEAGRNLLDQVRTEVKEGVLTIKNDNRCNWVRSFKPRIVVHVPIGGVKKLLLRGTGNCTSTDTIVADHFEVEQRNAQGTAELTVDVNDLVIALHTGAGDVLLHGRCNYTANLYSGIMAPIDASDMQTRFVNVNNSGISDIRCWVTEGLDVQLLDVGDVYYRGDPGFLQENISGSGELIHLP